MNASTATTRRSSGSGNSKATDLALFGLAGVLAAAAVLWVGAQFAAVLSVHLGAHGGLFCALAALGHPADPASVWATPEQLPGPLGYWTATTTVLALVAAAGSGTRRWWLPVLARHRCGERDVRRLPGLAGPGEVRATAGRSYVTDRAAVLRPALVKQDAHAARKDPRLVGYRLGQARGSEMWCSVEDSVLLVGPPRMGKGVHIVIPWVLDAPGSVVTTATRPETLAVTMTARKSDGRPVAIFDPQRLAGLPGGLRWSPVRGCESPRTALVRARGLAAGVGFGRGVSDGDFWSGQTETALRCLLHAAALDGRGALDLYRWSLNPALAEDAVTILNRDAHAAVGWADALEASVRADPRTRDSVWMGVRQSLAGLADPVVLDAVNPGPADRFDPVEFLASRGTLYLLASAVASGSCGPLIAAFVEDITETARARAARSVGSRLDPPLLLLLDEIANITPIPSLPALMAEGGGSGITTVAVLQSLAQARHHWGEHAADAIWDAATAKLVLGGLGKARDLDDISRLLGEVEEATTTFNRGRAGERSHSVSTRQVPVMPASVLRTLPFGTAVLLLRQARPIVIDMQPWNARRDAAALLTAQAAVEAETTAEEGKG